MNGAQAHLLLNHLPVFGVVFGLIILFYAIFRKSEEMKRVALGLFVLTALSTIPAYLTGEPAEELVEEMAEVSHQLIEDHEESALASLIAVEALGALSLLGLVLSRKRNATAPALLVNATVLLALAALTMVARTAHLGAQIHHPEIRSGFQMEGQHEGEGEAADAAEDRIGEEEHGEHEEDED